MGDKLMRNDTGQAIVTLLREFLNTQQSALESKIGTLSSLTTTAKASLVAAINELVANRGALNGLSTTAKSTIVAAINELVGVDSGHNTRISSLEDRVGRNNAGAHNSIYRGKNLGVFTEAHSAAIRNGTFENMYVGDYFTCPSGYTNTIWGNTTFVICGFNLFGDRNAKTNHVVLISSRFDNDTDHAFNLNSSTEGGYANCYWRTEKRPEYLEAAGHIFLDESHIFNHRESLSTETDKNVVTDCVVTDQASCELPDLLHLSGIVLPVYHDVPYVAANVEFTNLEHYPTGGHFPLFRLNPQTFFSSSPLVIRTRTIYKSGSIYCWSHYWIFKTNANNRTGISCNPYITIN